MRRLYLSLALGIVACFAGIGCDSCDVCTNVGGPCGYYSLAGRPLPPPVADAPIQPEAQPEPYDEPPPMPTGPTAPDIK